MIVLHHLNFSRSTRVLWLLEELGLPYELVRHERLPGFRAPKSLLAVHPAGKAPVVELDGAVMGESAAILAAIDSRYGNGAFSPKPGTDVQLRHDEWLHFAEGSMALPLMMALYGALIGGLPDLLGRIAAKNAKTVLDRLEHGLDTGPFLIGDMFSIADMQIAYLVDLARYLGLLHDRPRLLGYLAQFDMRPAYRKALTIGGPMMPPPLPQAATA